ncbi:ABC transporter ATP-binding protein [Granulosicoccus antarcticus]|uniref:Multidrug export ATP-binding/permease protein n=1 Tax=Granulosicoccus antarcticus IMCC3135 TaxID=1192854 RepID=A0A2Z2NUC0_9GAMM|nr:ABC transporter ATP-binding protein [Granulosicoccus antarcticus]ASJ74095.1 Putative multidrug export ATP-binding/permease protein [Granulosicoccus antarcticus IMCC3135]
MRISASQYQWIRQFLQPRILPLAGVMALAFLGTALSVLTPWITRKIIDDGLIAGNVSVLQNWVGIMLLVAISAALLTGINRIAYVALSSDMLMSMRAYLFDHLGSLSPGFYLRWRQGDLIARLDGDMGEVQRFLVDSLLAAFNSVLAFIGVIWLMLLLSPQLTLIAFVLVPASVLFLKLMRPRLEAQTRRFRESSTDVSALLVDRLPNMLLLQSFLAVTSTRKELDSVQSRYRDELLRNQVLGYWVATVPALFNTLATAAVFIIGGHAVINGSLTLGTLIAFASYLGRAAGPVNTLLGLYVAAQRVKVSLARLQQLLDEDPAASDPVQPLELPAGHGKLQFTKVSHTAAGTGSAPLWQPASLIIPAAARVWISGDSGAGKTTLLHLLQRHADPAHGIISLDSVALSDLTINDLRQAILLLQQDAPILDATVRDNLTLGGTFSDEQLIEAMNNAQLHPWLNSLDAGLDTRLGNRGARLSGGERQRLALTRAFLRQPRVLLLDEISAAMDTELENRIWLTVDRLFTRQSLLIVSHRRPELPGLSHELRLHDGRWQLEALP